MCTSRNIFLFLHEKTVILLHSNITVLKNDALFFELYHLLSLTYFLYNLWFVLLYVIITYFPNCMQRYIKINRCRGKIVYI